MKTAIPKVDRATLFVNTTQVAGTLKEEISGSIIYIYLNTKRVATAFTDNSGWRVSTSEFSFGGGLQQVQFGDQIYMEAKAVGKDRSDPTLVYIVGGIDQPTPPYVQDDFSQPKAPIYERQRFVAGDVPLLNGVFTFDADIINNVTEGVTVSIYVNSAFLATTVSDKLGHWTFDLWTIKNSPLLPLAKNDIVTARATRYSIVGGVETKLLAPSVESHPSKVLSGFFQQRLFNYLPMTMKDTDRTTGDLQNFTKILALTMDEVKSLVDQFTDIFDIDRCDPKYFDALAYLLGYPLNRLDSIESQRFQIKNAVELWKWKGTNEVFKIIFYMLNYNIEVKELWTNDYQLFYPTVMLPPNNVDYAYTDSEANPVNPPDDSPYLVENGGTWYKSPYFGVWIEPFVEMSSVWNPNGTSIYPYNMDQTACPTESNSKAIAFSPGDLKYLMERIDYFRPAHTVLDYIMFVLPLIECGPIPYEETETDVDWYPQEPGWYLPYCDPDDPIYYRDALRSTRPDGKGLLVLGVTRNPSGLHPSTDPTIKMKRLPERGYCHPGEDLEWFEEENEEENYYYIMRRDGMEIGGYPVESPIGTVDMNDWPSRNPYYPPTRDQTYRYASRLVITASP